MADEPKATYGIEESEDLLLFACYFANGMVKSWADGKFQIVEIVNFIKAGQALPDAIKDAALALKEFDDLDEEEVLQLQQVVKDAFDIEDDKVESFVEKCWNWVLSTNALWLEAKEVF